jgi:hypothetical protein
VQFQTVYWRAWEHLQLDLGPSSLIDDLDQILLGMAAMVKVKILRLVDTRGKAKLRRYTGLH